MGRRRVYAGLRVTWRRSRPADLDSIVELPKEQGTPVLRALNQRLMRSLQTARARHLVTLNFATMQVNFKFFRRDGVAKRPSSSKLFSQVDGERISAGLWPQFTTLGNIWVVTFNHPNCTFHASLLNDGVVRLPRNALRRLFAKTAARLVASNLALIMQDVASST